MRLDNPEYTIQECQAMLAQTTDDDEKASLLVAIHVSFSRLNKVEEARLTLQELKQLEISDLQIRLNAEFCEPTFLVDEGRYEEALAAFASMLDRHAADFKRPDHRYLYEDIQCRRASVFVILSRFKEALPLLREAASFSFSDPGTEQRVHFELGICLQDSNETEAAKQEFLKVVRFGLRSEFEEQALYFLGRIYYLNGALAQAKHQLETILRDFPGESTTIPRKVIYQSLSRISGYLNDHPNEKLYADLAKRSEDV